MSYMLLDCTLRDGGYLNNWEFGYSTIRYTVDRLQAAGIDVIEVGFLDDRVEASHDKTIFPDTEALNAVYGTVRKTGAMLVAMIDYGTCSIDHICDCKDTVIDGIRIIFKQPKMYGAMEFARQLKEKGYQVFLQMVSVTTYDDRALLDFVDGVKKVMPCGVSMVDTYGLMHKEDLLHIFHVLDHNLPKEIILGYHSHNNFQLGYANSIEMLKQKTDRTLLVDGTVYGMGKSAGNAPTELLAMHMNEVYGKHYDLNQLLELIDVVILRLKEKYSWGYTLKFFLSAANDCHPNYLTFLLGKKTLSIKSINEIISAIEPEKKLNYDEKYIAEKYVAYLRNAIDDDAACAAMRAKLAGREVLLVGPGASLKTMNAEVRAFIEEKKPVVISTNFVPDTIVPDIVFFASSKRYLFNQEKIEQLPRASKLAATSNVTGLSSDFDYVFNFEKWMDENPDIVDNSGVMCLKVLSEMDVAGVTLAGFDGFGGHANYAHEDLSYVKDHERLARVNESIRQRIGELGKKMPLRFLTPSLYEEKA